MTLGLQDLAGQYDTALSTLISTTVEELLDTGVSNEFKLDEIISALIMQDMNFEEMLYKRLTTYLKTQTVWIGNELQ